MQKSHIFELVTAILLSVAGVATSWSSYQASLWDGDQAALYNKATALGQESTLASTEAGQIQIVDIEMFLEWLNARAENHTKLEDFYRSHFRHEFIPAIEAWIASDPVNNPEAAATPFSLPEYKLAREEEGKKLRKESEELFAQGQTANDYSDQYVLNTVALAMVMFFAGISQQFLNSYVRIALLGVSLLMLSVGLLHLFSYPIAS